MNIKKSDKWDEVLRVIDRNGKWTGKYINRKEASERRNIYFNTAFVWIYDRKKDKVLLEKRSLNKKYNPGKLGLVGGHVTNDEVPIKTAIIETKEEINLDISNEKIYFIGVAKPDGVYKSFAYQFLVFANPSIKLLKIQEAEVEKLIYVSYKKIYNDVVNGSDNYSLTYPRFKNIFKKINYILKKPS